MPRSALVAAFIAVALSWPPATLATATAVLAGEAKAALPAHQVIGRFQTSLLETMKKAKFTSVEERYRMIEPHVDETFHVPLMARIATGKWWAESSEADRAAFAQSFRRYNIAYMATLLYTYSGQSFAFVNEQAGPQDTTIVRTRLMDPDGSVVKIAYVMKSFSGTWRAIDVILDEGISELTVRRSEYRDVLSKKGLAALAATLDAKVSQLLAQ